MEENSELEEGEAHCYKGDKDNIDPDTDLSYIVRVYLLFCFILVQFFSLKKIILKY